MKLFGSKNLRVEGIDLLLLALHFAVKASGHIFEEEGVDEGSQIKNIIALGMRIPKRNRQQGKILLVPTVAVVRQRASKGSASCLDELTTEASVKEGEELAGILLHVGRSRVFPAQPAALRADAVHRLDRHMLAVPQASYKLLEDAGLQLLLLHRHVVCGRLPAHAPDS